MYVRTVPFISARKKQEPLRVFNPVYVYIADPVPICGR